MRWIIRYFLIVVVAVLLCKPVAAQTTISILQDGSGDVESLVGALGELPNRLNEPYILEFQDSETYEETATVDVRIREGGSLTIRAASGQFPILRSDKNKKAAVILASSGVILEGLVLEGGNKRPGVHIEWSDHHTIRGCVIRGTRQANTAGIYIQGGQNNLVVDNDLTDNRVGIVLFDQADNNVIRNNRIFDNEVRGLWLYKEAAENQILHNSLWHNAIEIHIGNNGKKKDEPGENNQFLHNVVAAASGGTVIHVRREGNPGTLPPNTTSDFNLLFAPAGATFATLDNTTISDLGNWQSVTNADLHSVGTDPLFVDTPNDLHLQSTEGSYHDGAWIADGSHSPGIDAGDATAAVGDETDPNGGRVNLGAYGGTAQASRTGTAGPTFPSGAFNGVVAVTEGLGQHEVSIEISHPSGTESQVRLAWATAEAGPFSAATLAGPVTATQGSPTIDNAATYQLSAIPTVAGSNTVTFRWNSGPDVGRIDGQAWLQVTANDGSNDQETPAVLAVTVDNLAPQGLADLALAEAFSSRARLSWTAATSETRFDAYSIWYGTSAADVEARSGSAIQWSTGQDETLASISTSTTTISGLTRNTTYAAQIWARDNYGNETTDGPIRVETTNLDTIIHYVAASGSNNGVANDPGQPWNSIVRAVNEIPNNLVNAEAAYIVRILDSSSYQGTPTLNNTTDATYNITIDAPGQSPLLQASNNKMGIIIKAAYTIVDGLAIESTNKWGINIVTADHTTIRNCTIFDATGNNVGGLRIHKSSNTRIYDNRIHTNPVGIRISEDADFASLRNNLILMGAGGTRGIFVDKKADADTLINNTIVGFDRGIYFRGPGNNNAGDGHVIRNNIFHDVATGYHLDRELGAIFALLAYNNIDVRDGGNVGSITGTTYATMAEWRTATGAAEGSISLDPQFVDTATDAAQWDLHLKSQAGRWTSGGFVADDVSSPAIDAGHPRDAVGAETAPNGNRINLGVYGGTAQASRSGNVAVAQGGLPWGEYLFGGVPIVPVNGDPDAVLGDDFPGLGEDPWGFWWRLVRWDATRDDYVYYKEDEGIAGDPPDFVPGLGYWLIQWWSVEENGEVLGDTVTVDGTPVSSADNYEIPLQVSPAGGGFNQIANPFLFDIDFADARLRNGQGREFPFSEVAGRGAVDAYAYLWDWEEQAYVPISSDTGGRIPAWRGFWIEQLNPNVNLTLVLPPIEAESGVSRPLAAARIAADNWYVEFAVRGTGTFEAPEGPVNVSIQDISNRAGVKPEASRRYDRYDARDLPVLSPAFVYVYFPHGDPEDLESAYWPDRPARYTFDIRDADWDEQSWLFVVETSLAESRWSARRLRPASRGC